MYVYNVQKYGQGESICDGYGRKQSDDDSERDAESIAETESESKWKPGTEPDAKPVTW